MSDIKKYIIGGIFVIIIVVSAYYIFIKKSDASGGGTLTRVCPYGLEKNGDCVLPPDFCGQDVKPPPGICDTDQQLICDQKTQKWRCKSSCETPGNPFPSDFSLCETKNVKCDTNGKYYCKSDYCKNGGILYSNANGICSCPSGYIGDKCEYDTSKCKGGEFDINTGICNSCCDSTTSFSNGKSKLCKYYGNNCEQKCKNENYVYDPQSGICVCPKCFLEKENGECNQLENCCKNGTIQGNKCVCDGGWTGVNCDISICGTYGTWDNNTKKCICLKDDNGNNIAVGDKCQYTQDMCNGNGFPVIFNGVPSCICKPNFSGAYCSCDDSIKPKGDTYTCEGVSSYCTDKGWAMKFLECDDIYKQPEYGTEQLWQKQCTNYLTGETYPDYEVRCKRKNIPDKDGINTFVPSQQTCSATPTKEMLAVCKQDNKCFVGWDDTNIKSISNNISNVFNKVCTCHSSENGVSYQCDPISANNKCGDSKNVPKGFCIGPDGNPVDPECINCGEEGHVFACKGSVLPKSCAISHWSLEPNAIHNSHKLWYNTTQDSFKNTVFPTINMDTCESPYNSLNDLFFEDAYKSVNSAKGFVTGLGTNSEKFYDIDDENIIVYNINANINKNTNQIEPIYDSKHNNFYPFPDSYKDDMFKENTGCAKIKQYDEAKDNNTQCASDIGGRGNAGQFKQYCSDSSYNIVDCDSVKAYFKTDKGYCDCGYYPSTAQPSKYVTHKGRYCQYNDNTTCNGKGIVDDNGKCECLPGYVGNNCQYDDSICNYHGKAQNDGSCICKGKNRTSNCSCQNDTSYSINFGDDCYTSLLTTLDINNNLIISPGAKYYMKLNSKNISGKTAIDNIVISKIDNSSSRVIFTNNDPNCTSINGYINDKSVPFWFAYEYGINTNTGSSIYYQSWPPPDQTSQSSDIPWFKGTKIILEDDGLLHFLIYTDYSTIDVFY